MGYASFLEDIVQRLNSDLGKIKTEINAKKVASEKQKDYVRVSTESMRTHPSSAHEPRHGSKARHDPWCP